MRDHLHRPGLVRIGIQPSRTRSGAQTLEGREHACRMAARSARPIFIQVSRPDFVSRTTQNQVRVHYRSDLDRLIRGNARIPYDGGTRSVRAGPDQRAHACRHGRGTGQRHKARTKTRADRIAGAPGTSSARNTFRYFGSGTLPRSSTHTSALMRATSGGANAIRQVGKALSLQMERGR